MSRLGKARQIGYINRESGLKRIQAAAESHRHDIVFLSLENCFDALRRGVFRFAGDLLTNADLRERVFHHMGEVVDEMNFDFADEDPA
ncbi:MAG: hypothetical protein ACR2NX_16775 [Chthoniobacterales bacterium]